MFSVHGWLCMIFHGWYHVPIGAPYEMTGCLKCGVIFVPRWTYHEAPNRVPRGAREEARMELRKICEAIGGREIC